MTTFATNYKYIKKMGNKPNKYIAVAYKLYTITDGKSELVEEAPADKPFRFISGFGLTLDDFEKAIDDLEENADFDFTLTPDKAYGEYVEERILDLDKSIFSINGKFDNENIFKDAIVPLQNEDGNRFMGHVLDITDDTVKIDLNHPLAGKELNFKGRVIETREATAQEVQSIINAMNNEGGCGCGCDDCEGGCNHEEGGCDHKEGCDHEHHHEHGVGCGCGHCH
jgi:FKBP-type peptidyl-prolyl cis-trans isomerase SlyD